MSDAGVDDLIDELFPEKRLTAGAPKSGAGRRQSEWDDDSDAEAEAPPVFAAAPGSGSAGSLNIRHAPPQTHAGHSFDSDSDDGNDDFDGDVAHTSRTNAVLGGASAPTREASGAGSRDDVPSLRRGMSCPVLHPVPFPSLADSEGSFACASRCYLTNRGATLKGDSSHPTLLQLRELAVNERALAGCTRVQAMLRKGAFHAVALKLGNGCLDHHGDCSNDGGCPYILCRKCNYMVVRLQGAEWDDDEGRVNLYLTLRNYYPDWCRLASETPVGVEDASRAGARHVLKVNAACAAYCCQCCWLTVRSPKAVIETKLTDAFLVKAGEEGRHPFATELPLVAGEKRRPPLWVCHGHPQ